MKIKVKFFAYTREITGLNETEIEIKEGTNLAGIMDMLAERFPGLRRYRSEINMAVNHEYAPPETIVNKGDEVALLPPVSGG